MAAGPSGAAPAAIPGAARPAAAHATAPSKEGVRRATRVRHRCSALLALEVVGPLDQPRLQGLAYGRLGEVARVVHGGVRRQGQGAPYVPATLGQVDRAHRLDVDDEVVRSEDDLVHHTVDESFDDGRRDLRRVVVDRHLEVRGHDEPRRPRPRLAALVGVEVGDERAVRDHRGDARHAVGVRGERREPADEGTDPPHRTNDESRHRRSTRERRDRAGVRGDEVGVEVGQVGPPGRVREVGARVGGTHEDGPVDLAAPGQPGQDRLHEAAGGEPTPAVADDVDGDLASAERRHMSGELSGVLERVLAEGLVVEAENGVVVGERLREELAPRLGSGQGPERTDGRVERAVDEKEYPVVPGRREPGVGERVDVDPLAGIHTREVHEPGIDEELEGPDGARAQERRRIREDRRPGGPRGEVTQVAAVRPGRRDDELEEGDATDQLWVSRGLVPRSQPRVAPVVLEQHDRVLLGRDVESERDGGALTATGVAAPGSVGRDDDSMDVVETVASQRVHDERVDVAGRRQVDRPRARRGRPVCVRVRHPEPAADERRRRRHFASSSAGGSPPRTPGHQGCTPGIASGGETRTQLLPPWRQYGVRPIRPPRPGPK